MASQPYTKVIPVILESAGIVQVQYASRPMIYSITIVHSAGTQFNASVYNRKFTGPVLPIKKISAHGATDYSVVDLYSSHGLSPGDAVEIDGTSGHDDTDAVVLENLGPESLLVAVDFVSEERTGTLQLSIPAWAQPAFTLYPEETSTAGGVLVLDGSQVPFNCQDSRQPGGIAQPNMYFDLSQAGTYLISISGEINP